MVWTISYSLKAEKTLRKLDRELSQRIMDYLKSRVAVLAIPCQLGEQLKGDFWRYRVGNYRVLCAIQDNALIILAVEMGHKSKNDD